MSADSTPLFEFVPHPHIKEPCLYIADPPGRLKWEHLQSVFASCGLVRSGGKGPIDGTNRKKWKVQFLNLHYAEMALATLPGIKVQGVEPPWFLNLWATSALTPSMPVKPLLPLFFYLKREWTMSHSVDAQTIFQWFRRAGPVLAVHLNVDIGYEQPACLVEYYLPEHLQATRRAGVSIHHDVINAVRHPFRVIDPWNLYCANLGPDVKTGELRSEFSKFGAIVDARMMKAGIPDAWGFVSFADRNCAANAMHAMRAKSPWGGSLKIVVRYHEPKAAAKFTPHIGALVPNTYVWYKPGQGLKDCNVSQDGGDDANTTGERREPEEVGPTDVADPPATNETQEANAARAASTRSKIEAVKAARLKNESALVAEKRAKDERDVAQSIEDAFAKDLVFAEALAQAREQEYEVAQTEFDDATQIFNEALKRLDEARESLAVARGSSNQATRDKEKATQELEGARERRKVADTEASRAQDAREAAEAELHAAINDDHENVDDEKARREELEESIRKMAEMRKQEEEDRQRKEAERERKEAEERERKRKQKEAEERAKEEARRAEEERKRREKEEADRKEREKREAEERAKREAIARQQTYQRASAQEKERCRKRDQTLRISVFWNLSRSLERFRLVSTEFDDIKFCATQPLTFESIPWPILKSPFAATITDVEWHAVEQFFDNVKLSLPEEEYRALVEKAHRRFHPDKWRARGILHTVLDEELRQRLENACNVVSQALGPIWTKSRAK